MTAPTRNRVTECAQIEEAALVTVGGARRTMVITGEAGIGKSYLLDEAVRILRRSGLTVATAKAESFARDRPFGLIRRAIDSITMASDATTVGNSTFGVTDRIFGAPDGEFRGLVDAPELGFRVIDQIADVVGRLAAERPLALVLDDLQWADHGSLDALMALHERLHDRALLTLTATRPAPATDRFERFMAGVRRDDLVRLGPLDHEAVEELLTVQLGSRPTHEQMDWYARADGNPLFIKTLVASDGSARQRGPQGDPVDLPDSVRRLVAMQLRELDDETRALLDIGATVGGPFTVSLLAAIGDLPLRQVIGRVDLALNASLLIDGDVGLAFRHDLVRDVIYADIAPSVLASLHLAIGHHLIERAASPADASFHFVLGARHGDVEAAAVLRQAAAEIGRVAPVEASKLLERALDVLPSGHHEYDSTVVELAQSYVFSDRLDASLELVEERLVHGIEPSVEIDLRNARTQVFFLRGEPRHASDEFELIAGLVADDPREPVVLADASVAAMFAVDLERARERAKRSLATSLVEGDTSAAPLALGVLSWLAALQGDVTHGVDLAVQAVGRAERIDGLEGHRRVPHLFHAQCLLWANRPEEAVASLRRGRRISAEIGMGWDEPMYHALAADERIRQGEWDDALAEIEAGLRRGAEVGATFSDSWLHVHHARVLFARGRFGEIGEVLDRAMSGTAGRGGQGVDQVWWLNGMLLATTDPSAAVAVLSSLWEKLDELGVVLRQFEYAVDIVAVALAADRLDFAGQIVDRVQTLADLSSSSVGQLALKWSQGLLSNSAEQLETAADLASGGAGPVIVARARADAARVRGDAMPFGDLEALGGYGWGQWLTGSEQPTNSNRPVSGWEGLTNSERRVVTLVGDGKTNAEIAEELNVSRRTVESHLYHSYPKLDLSSRIELVLFVNRRLQG